MSKVLCILGIHKYPRLYGRSVACVNCGKEIHFSKGGHTPKRSNKKDLG